MRILIVTQYFWPETFRINDLAQGLPNRGHEVTVYTGKPNYPGGGLPGATDSVTVRVGAVKKWR